MDTITLTQQLKDHQQFQARVKEARPFRAIFLSLIVAAVILFIINLVIAFSTLNRYGLPTSFLWDVLWMTELESGSSARAQMWTYIYVWGPPILLVLAIVFLVLDLATKANYSAGLYQRYVQGGYVAERAPLGTKVTIPGQNASKELHLLSHPNQPIEQFHQLAGFLAGRLAQADKAQTRELQKAIGAGKGHGTVNSLWPDIQEFNLVTINAPGKGLVVVVPNETPHKAPHILALKG